MRGTLALVVLVLAVGCSSAPRPSLQHDAPRSEASPGSVIPDPERCPPPDDGSQAALAVLAGRTLVSIDRGTAAFDHALELARDQHSAVWVVCLDDAMARLRALRPIVESRATQPIDGEAEIAREITAMRETCERASELQRDARMCGAASGGARP